MVTPRSGRRVAVGASRRVERGSASVLALGASALLLLLLGVLIAVGAGLSAGTRARAAADLAALAGAGALISGEDPRGACAAARRVATGNGARLTGCTAEPATSGRDGPAVTVLVEVEHRLVGLEPARARARAGGVPSRSAS